MSLWRFSSILDSYFSIIKTNTEFCKKILSNRFLPPNLSFFGLNKNEKGFFHTSSSRKDLMEFFDSKENWSALEIRVGRSWKKEELRLKSNSDLHKLWYVLLKEKNMLLTMQHEYNKEGKCLPSPERLDKVEESMENLESVVRERNRAYFQLETGETGERPSGISTNCFGLEYKYKMSEHLVEKRFNRKYWKIQKLYNLTNDYEYVKNFLVRLEEKKRRIAYAKQRRSFNYACNLMKTFPNLDEEAFKAEFPQLDIEKVKKDPKSRGHKENIY